MVIFFSLIAYFLVKSIIPIRTPNISPAPIVRTSPSLTPTPIDETANWKPFYDNLTGISFRYPSDWIMGSGAEGCGPIFGPKAKYIPIPTSNPSISPIQQDYAGSSTLEIFPFIAFCAYNNSNLPGSASFSDSVKFYSSFGKLASTTKMIINNHQLATILKVPADDGEAGAIIIDDSNQNPKKSFIIYLYIFYDEKYYKIYGSKENFSFDEFLKKIDQVVSTLKFSGQTNPIP